MDLCMGLQCLSIQVLKIIQVQPSAADADSLTIFFQAYQL